MNKFVGKRGISLIVLVITIITMLILAGAIIISVAKNTPIDGAEELRFKNDARDFSNTLSIWIEKQYSASPMGFDSEDVNADYSSVSYNGLTITDIIPRLSGSEYLKKFKIASGELVYVGMDDSEIKFSQDIGIEVYLPYVKDGLVLWYDGIDNGGLGVHNDNNNGNRGTWFDLSGNGNNMSLSSTDFTSSDGWSTNCLVLDGTSHNLTSNNPLKNQTQSSQSYTIEAVYKTKVINTVLRSVSGINNGFYLNYYSSRGLHYINSGSNDYYSYSKSIIPLDTITSSTGSYIKDATNNKVLMYTNATDKMLNNYSFAESLTKIPYGMSASLTYSNMVNIELYSIRIYNRVLTDDEISKNFKLDKTRFGIQ